MSRVVVGYVRVSTESQAEHGVSLDAQTAKLNAMATVQGVQLSEIISDGGESAKSLDRPGLQRLLAMVDAGKVQTIIVAKLDRLTRSVKDLCCLLERLEKRKVALVSVAESLDTSSAAGRLVLHIMGAVSEWERASTAERTAMALRHLRAGGKVWNHVPFGYERRGKELVKDAGEQSTVSRIFALRSGGASLRKIAAALNAANIPTKMGKRWQARQVADVIRLNSRADVAA